MPPDEEFVLEKCPRCGYETPVEPLGNEEGVLETVICAQCGSLFIQKPSGPSGDKQLLVAMDRREQRKTGALDKIKSWWKGRQES